MAYGSLHAQVRVQVAVSGPGQQPLRLADFYSLLGLVFDHREHGNSPMHYATTMGSLVLEVYPLTKNQTAPGSNLRLGFAIDNFEETLDCLKNKGIVFSAPNLTDFGFLAIVSDPDG
jgi:lactoylglutathione lyase